MKRIKLAVHLPSLRIPLRQALHAAQRMGVEAVELDGRGEFRPHELSASGLREFKKQLQDLELRVAAVEFRTRRGYHIAAELEQRIEATKAAMRGAFAVGASLLVNQVGRVPEDPKSAEFRVMTEALTDLGRFGDHVGVTLTAETGTESGPDLLRMIEALPAGALGVAFNPGRLIINGFSAQEALAPLAPHVRLLRAQDGVQDLARGRGIEVELGRGSADWAAILGTLEEHGYRGYVSVLREQSEDPLFEIGRAVKYLHALTS